MTLPSEGPAPRRLNSTIGNQRESGQNRAHWSFERIVARERRKTGVRINGALVRSEQGHRWDRPFPAAGAYNVGVGPLAQDPKHAPCSVVGLSLQDPVYKNWGSPELIHGRLAIVLTFNSRV